MNYQDLLGFGWMASTAFSEGRLQANKHFFF